MKHLFFKNTLLSRSVFVVTVIGLMLSLSSCSNTIGKEKTKTTQTLNKQQKVEFGTVVAVRTVQIKADTKTSANPYGNIGVSASSGGFRGIHASIDLATFSRLFKNNTEVKTAQEVIVKKSIGETVAITQAFKENFKKGDTVKILVRNGYAQVIH